MKKAAIGIFSLGIVLAGVANAGEEEVRQRIKNEMTASIPAAGVHAMQEIRRSLAAELPRGLPLKQQVEQLRAALGARKASDRI